MIVRGPAHGFMPLFIFLNRNRTVSQSYNWPVIRLAHRTIHSSFNLLTSTYLDFDCGGNSLSGEAQTSLSPASSSSSPRRTPRPAGRYRLCLVVFSWLDMTSQSNWLLLMWRSSDSALSPSQVAELLTPSLRKPPCGGI